MADLAYVPKLVLLPRAVLRSESTVSTVSASPNFHSRLTVLTHARAHQGLLGRRAPILFAVFLLLGSTAAIAQSPACANLERQLAASLASDGSSPSAEQVARRLTGQQAEAAANGCAGYNPSTQINRLRTELTQAQGGGGSARLPGISRDAIRQQLAQLGCTARAAEGTAYRGDPKPIGIGARTLCVRTCDGYFFPIGNASQRDRYTTDAETCQSMYAEAGVAELFIQLRRDDVASAVPVDGTQRYADQPYAFAYRQEYDRACHSELQSGLRALTVRYIEAARALMPSDKTTGKPSTALLQPPDPRLRPDAVGEDPETTANRAGGLMVGASLELKSMASSLPPRQVGPYVGVYDLSRPHAPGPRFRPPLGFDLLGNAMADHPGSIPFSQ
jgi:hypothetical protein